MSTVSKPCTVVETIQRRMQGSMYRLRTVECEFEDGLLTLRGVVPTFYLKQVLLSFAEDLEVEGVQRVIDEIDVVNPRGLSSERRAS